MKKTTLLIAAGCISAALISGRLCAQDSKEQAALTSAATATSSPAAAKSPATAKSSPAAASSPSPANTVNSTISLRTRKDFKGRFAGAKGELWFPVKTGLLASFTVDGFQCRAFYDKKGRWQSCMRDLSEKQLPRAVRAIVKSTYYDFAITLARIIEIPGHLVYLIYLEDDNSFRVVRVNEEYEMDVLEEFKKVARLGQLFYLTDH